MIIFRILLETATHFSFSISMERRFMSVSLKSKLRFSLLKLRSGGSPGDWDKRWEERLQDRKLQP